jgi:uncharacterized protein (TIGR03067 family)
MKPVAVLTLVLSVGLISRADDKKTEAPKIAGAYKLVAGKKDGKETEENAKKAKYTIDDKKITIADKEGKFVIAYKLDGTKIDMEILEAPFEGLKGSKGYGIVEMKGETLKLAYVTEKDKRPKDFKGEEGFLFELKKEKNKPKE